MSSKNQPFLLTQQDRESRRLEALTARQIDSVAAGTTTCTNHDETIGGFTVCNDENGNIHQDQGNIYA